MPATKLRVVPDPRGQSHPGPRLPREAARDGALTLSLSHLNKGFAPAGRRAIQAVADVSLNVREGEMLVLLGPSGCGKTTLLRCVAGLEKPDTGQITIGSRLVFSDKPRVEIAPQRRPISMMFQSYALWPHMSTFDNVAYPLRARGVPADAIGERVRGMLEAANISELAGEYPARMSGGQQQRVALARAMVTGAPLILFDEPLSNVDAKVREQLRREIATMQARYRFAGLYVTHDQKEALALAHRIAALDSGRIAQIGTPQELYDEPVSTYVASLLGPANHFEGVVKQSYGQTVLVDTEVGPVRGRAASSAAGMTSGKKAIVLFRPEAARLAKLDDACEKMAENEWAGIWESHVFAGSHTEVLVRVSTSVQLCAWSSAREGVLGRPVKVRVPEAAVRILGPTGDGAQAP